METFEGEDHSVEERKNKLKDKLFSWVEDNYDKIFLLTLLLALGVRIFVFFKTFDQPIWWDAADYLTTAKNWAGLNPHLLDTWYYRRGFMWPLISSLFFRFGLGELSVRFLVVLLSTGIVATSYFLIKEMFNKELAIYTSIMASFSWVFLFFSGRPLTSLPATFFLILSILFFWKGYVSKKGEKYFYLFGAFYAIAILTRMQFLLFGLPLLIFAFTKEKLNFLRNKSLWKSVITFFILFSPLLFMYYQYFGNPLTDILNYYFRIGGLSQTGELGGSGDLSKIFNYFVDLPYALTIPIFSLFIVGLAYLGDLILGLDKIFKSPRIQKKLFIFFWIATNFLVLGYITEFVEHRYMAPSLIFIFLICSFPLLHARRMISHKLKISPKKAFFIICAILLLLTLPGLKFGSEFIDAKKNSYTEIKQAGEWIKENSNPEDIVISDSLPQTIYYSERVVYPFELSYRRDIVPKGESEFNEFVERERPRYAILSVLERHPDWALTYPQNYPGRLNPKIGLPNNDNPLLVIYEFSYEDLGNGEIEIIGDPQNPLNHTNPII